MAGTAIWRASGSSLVDASELRVDSMIASSIQDSRAAGNTQAASRLDCATRGVCTAIDPIASADGAGIADRPRTGSMLSASFGLLRGRRFDRTRAQRVSDHEQ